MTGAVIHVIDDDEAMRESLRFLLESAGFEAQTYDCAEAFLATIAGMEGGCVVTDVRMPGMSGLDLVRRLKAISARLPVIVITGHGDVPLAVEAMKAGVVDFLEKPFDDDVFLKAVAAASHQGEDAARDSSERRRCEAILKTLSPREQDVLRGVVAGKLNKIIAFELGISPRTVEVYRANVMTKTGASSVSELVRMTLLAEF